MVKSEPKKKPQFGGFFQKFFRKPERNEKEQRLTVQRSIPYLEMGRDGICRVEEHLYSKTVRFYDINYQLAQNEDKNTIFESWCDFLNYFDASIRFQLSFINHKSDMSEYNKVIQIEPQHDAFDDVRMEYAQMLKQQLAKGNNGLVRTKYITFSISSMEDAAIQQGFENLKDGAAYDNLFAASECRAKADWLIGMNGTRAFTKKYGRKQTIGRVQTPTLAMLAERQAKIQNFVKEPYYKVELSGAGVVAVSEQMAQEQDADTMQAACDGQCAVVGSIERKRVEKKPPKLYDLTTLQREANRYYGMTASQTLQALQELYEEKLVTYPRTDSQFVTEDMRKTVESLVLALDGAAADVSCVINNSKVTDHHAILPTMQGAKCNKEKLSETKQKILSLIIWKLVQAVQSPFIYEDVLVTVCCQGRNFTAKYKDVLQPGYTAKPVPLVEPEKNKDASLPNDLEQGMVIPVVRAEKKQGFTSPPKVYTEDTMLLAMETAGNKEFEKDTEKKGLGTPATRAAILEKLVSSDYVQRKGKQMIPTEDGVAAIRNIPDYLKSASMTAEWENDLLRMERGEIKPYDFMQGIHGLLDKMLADLRQIPTVAVAPNHNKVSVGSCPVCGNPVHESKLSFCCADRSCKFALWKESRYLSNMRKTLDKKMAVDLLKKGRTHVKDFYSAKKDKTFAADLVMRVEEGRAQYSLEFPKTPMKTKT